jgi:hypothetical protein
LVNSNMAVKLVGFFIAWEGILVLWKDGTSTSEIWRYVYVHILYSQTIANKDFEFIFRHFCFVSEVLYNAGS